MVVPRMRMAVVAGTMALSFTLGAVPAAMAQDGPATPVEGVLSALDEGRLAEATSYFCADFQDQAAGGIGQLDLLGDIGLDLGLGLGLDLDLDLELLLGAVQLSVDDLAVSVADETETTAKVALQANLEASINEDGLVALATSLLSTEDAPMDPEIVKAMLPVFLTPEVESQFSGSFMVDETVDVVLEDGAWKLCGDTASLSGAISRIMGLSAGDSTISAEPSAVPADGDAESE